MAATVIAPTPGQTVVTTDDGRDYSRSPHRDLGKLIVSEQAAYGRIAAEQHGEIRHDIGDAKQATSDAKFDVVAALDQRHVAAADRLADASRDIMSHVAHVGDASREGLAKLQHELAELGYRQLGAESRMLLEMQRHSTESERRAADARVEALKDHCEIKDLIRCEGSRTRDLIDRNRMRDLESDNLKLQMKLNLLEKP